MSSMVQSSQVMRTLVISNLEHCMYVSQFDKTSVAKAKLVNFDKIEI